MVGLPVLKDFIHMSRQVNLKLTILLHKNQALNLFTYFLLPQIYPEAQKIGVGGGQHNFKIIKWPEIIKITSQCLWLENAWIVLEFDSC